MMIKIKNLRYESPKYPWDFKIDRTTPLGNPFPIKTENKGDETYRRDEACNRFDQYVLSGEIWKRKGTLEYFNKLMKAHAKYRRLNLFCW